MAPTSKPQKPQQKKPKFPAAKPQVKATRGRPKKVASAASVGGAGGSFENRVQAVKLLGLVLGVATPGVPESSRIVKLQFQARVLGVHTDDLVCTVESSNGTLSRVLMQMKRGLSARKSDKAFEEAVGNAWLDFQTPVYGRLSDRILIVHDAASSHDMRGAHEVVRHAKTSTLALEWIEKLTAAGAGSALKRNALVAMRASVDVYKGSAVADDEFFQFARHLDFVAHDLDVEGTAEYVSYTNLIRMAAAQCGVLADAELVWAKLVGACMTLNAEYGAVDFQNLAFVIGGDLAIWFSAYRGKVAQPFARVPPIQGSISNNPSFSMPAGWSGIGTTSPQPTFGSDQPSSARTASVDKFISGQLDQINNKIKECRYTEALNSLQQIGNDLGALDNHQKARWYHMRGICRWHRDDSELEAADDFIMASSLCDDDDKLAAARIRGFLLKKDITGALRAGVDARARFPQSFNVWVSATNARLANEEAIERTDIPAEHLHEADAFQLVAFSLHAKGRLTDARNLSVDALSLPTSNFFTRNLALSFVLEDIAENPLNLAFRLLTTKDSHDLTTVLKSFEPRHTKLWSIEAPKLQADAAYRLAFGHLLLGASAEALAIVTEAVGRGIDNTNLRRVEMEALSHLGRADEAIEAGKKSLESMPVGALLAFGQVANSVKNVAAIEAAIDVATRLYPTEKSLADALTSFRWETLLRADSGAVVLHEIATLDAKETSSIPLLVIASRALHKYNRDGDAAFFIARAEELAAASDQPGEKYMVASLLLHLRQHKKAAGLLEVILPSGQFSELHVELLYCYVRSGARAKALALLNDFPAEWRQDELARNVAIELGQAAGDWVLLKSLVDAQIQAAPNQARCWLFKLLVELHVSQVDFKRAIGSLPAVLEGTVHEQAQLGNAELGHGFEEQGMRRLYRMRRNNLNSAEAAAAYISTHLLASANLPLLHTKIDAVAAGASVTIRGEDGVVTTFTIDPEECGDLPETEEFRVSTSPVLKQLLGRKQGEQFTVEDGFGGKKSYTVVDIVTAFRRLLELAKKSLHVSLEPSKTLTAITLDEGKEGALKFEKLTQQLNKTAEAAHDVFELYESTQFTLGVTARMLGRDVVTLVRSWPAQKHSLVVGGGTAEVREEALELMRQPGVSYVVDAATLTELAQTGCLKALAMVPDVFVSNTTLDILRGRLAAAENDRSAGVASTEGGRLVFHEISPENHSHEIAFFKELCETVEHLCTIVPAYGPLTQPPELGEVELVLSREEYAVLLVALERQSTLLALDQRLRMMAAYCGLGGVWPQIFLVEQLLSKKIAQRDYSLACAQMFFRNRTFISLRAQDLLMMVYQGDALLNHGLRHFIKHISLDTTEFKSAARVTLDFIRLMVRSGECQFGVVLEFIERLLEGLFRHKNCTDGFERRALEFLRQPGNTGEWRLDAESYFRIAISSAKNAALRPMNDAPIRARVIFCTSPPYLLSGLTDNLYFERSGAPGNHDLLLADSSEESTTTGNCEITSLTPNDLSGG